jgi:Uma2 family endonuclease
MSLPEGTRAELIDGELFMCPSPRSRHQDTAGNLFALLRDFVRHRSLGRVFVAPLDVHLPSGDIVEPDILYVAKANLGIVHDWVRGAPDLIIEVLSPESIDRDRFVKRDLYAKNGVREYWIVDLEEKTIEVLSLVEGQYEPRGYFEFGDVLVSPLLAEFKLPLADVFAESLSNEESKWP